MPFEGHRLKRTNQDREGWCTVRIAVAAHLSIRQNRFYTKPLA